MQEDSGLMKVRFPIGAKLIAIITIIMLMAIGSIIFLVSWLVRADLQIVAEENNFEANRSSALAAETYIDNIQSNTMILIRTITSLGTESALARETVDFFFEKNPNAVSVFFTARGQTQILVNESFFVKMKIASSSVWSYWEAHDTYLRRAALGQTVLLNATPHFKALALALFFPSQDSTPGGVLFSPAQLSDSFGSGVNQSYLINDAGDILIHADFETVYNGVNIASLEFTRFIWSDSSSNAQTLYADENGVRYFSAFTKLNTSGAIVITSIEHDKVFEGINATTRRNMYLTAAVLSISVIFIWFFSKGISVPLRMLAAAAHKIETGAFDITLKPRGRDEIGVLTASFTRMCKALGIFGRFTNKDIALRAMRGEIKPGGFKKRATIFFSDIRGFTATSESFTNQFGDEASDKIVQWLNKYFTQMVDCVDKTGGVVDKFIGDALMAHWGTAYTSGSTRKDAYNCIRAALLMRNALIRMNKERGNDTANPQIRIGCGINTGMVTAGQLGSEQRMEYTVIGDPVNLASRVEALNKSFGTDILITEGTWRLVRKRFITEEMPSVKVKGKANAIRIFAVINFAHRENGPKTIEKVRRLLGIKSADYKSVKTKEEKYSVIGTG